MKTVMAQAYEMVAQTTVRTYEVNKIIDGLHSIFKFDQKVISFKLFYMQ